ncbi:MAG: hypothetical protein AAF662_12250 [Pseudomonadota bacterium]
MNAGIVAQHWWFVRDDDDRDSVSQTNIQYFRNYRLGLTKQIEMRPTIGIDWKEEGGNRYSVPIEVGYSDTLGGRVASNSVENRSALLLGLY